MRFILALLAVVGIAVSAMALREHYRTDTSPCSINEKWDCGIVNHSPYAVLWGVPVATIGIAGYLLLCALALKRWIEPYCRCRWERWRSLCISRTLKRTFWGSGASTVWHLLR